MGEEGGDDVDTLLAVALLLDLDLLGVVEDALEGDRLHGPVALELVEVGLVVRPDVGCFVGRSNVRGFCAEEGIATSNLCLFLLSAAVLVLSSLVHEDCDEGHWLGERESTY